MEPMQTIEMCRLADWLLANGHTEADVIECLNAIAGK